MTCLHCTADTNGVTLCARCRETLTTALVNVAAYFADALAIQPGQRVKVRSAFHSAPPPSPDPPRDPISDATDHVATIVYGWCRNLADDRPEAGPMPATTERRCGWLGSHVPSVLTLEWAGELLREMLDCERMLRRILDRADTGWYAGVCGNEVGREETDDGEVRAVTCERGLYVTQGQPWTRCPECGRHWDADERRRVMRAEAEERTAPVRVLAKIAVGLTDEPSEERLIRRIEKWVDRQWLTPAGTKVVDGKPRKVYRIGDVLALIEGRSVASGRIGA